MQIQVCNGHKCLMASLEQLHQFVYKGAKWKKQLLFTQFDQKNHPHPCV